MQLIVKDSGFKTNQKKVNKQKLKNELPSIFRIKELITLGLGPPPKEVPEVFLLNHTQKSAYDPHGEKCVTRLQPQCPLLQAFRLSRIRTSKC